MRPIGSEKTNLDRILAGHCVLAGARSVVDGEDSVRNGRGAADSSGHIPWRLTPSANLPII